MITGIRGQFFSLWLNPVWIFGYNGYIMFSYIFATKFFGFLKPIETEHLYILGYCSYYSTQHIFDTQHEEIKTERSGNQKNLHQTFLEHTHKTGRWRQMHFFSICLPPVLRGSKVIFSHGAAALKLGGTLCLCSGALQQERMFADSRALILDPSFEGQILPTHYR